MKKLLVFTLILASNSLFACGFYPYGEQLRFCLFYPGYFNNYHYSEFNYSSTLFGPEQNAVYSENESRPNEDLWIAFCKNKVPLVDIREVLGKFNFADIDVNSSNKMIQYLYRIKNKEAFDYLKFAKRCEYLTVDPSETDYWEKNEDYTARAKRKLIAEAVTTAAAIKNQQLKLRYTFLAIRLAYYNNDKAKINQLFDVAFKNVKNKNILYYWSLYFKSFAEENRVLGSFYATQVFANCPEKRFAVYSHYNKSLPIESVLKYAKTQGEINNIQIFYALRNPSKSIDVIRELYSQNPKSEGLNFLVLREMNKIDDWVFTPYYTLFHPSLENNWFGEEDFPIHAILKRVESDRAYAQKVLDFINTVNFKEVKDAVFWETCKAHLLFVTQHYDESLAAVNQLEQKIPQNDSIYNQLQIIKALNLAANQPKGKAIITDEMKPILLKNKTDKQFLFAIGRELEMNGNSTDAALLFSKLISDGEIYQYNVVWKTKKHLKGSYQDYFSSYSDYIERMYSPKQLEDLIADIAKNSSNTDDFSVWKYSLLAKQTSNLHDFLGTKYIRQNNLQKALANFKKIEKGYWISYYDCLWERKKSNGLIFDSNPFFEVKWAPDFIKEKEYFQLNKLTVTQHLIEYLTKANNSKERNRDYYYFLVANCYYNMSINGNSWMMRRFGYSDYDVEPFPEDEKEFRESNFSDYYYLQAYKYAKTNEFKALCLRLANLYDKLNDEFPDDYYPLCNGCTAFEDYFNART